MKTRGKIPPDPDLAKWCQALAAPVVVDEVPPGWVTARDLMGKLGKAESTIGKLLHRAVRDGRAERQDFRVAINGATRPIPHYRLK
jgi:hypothetical protein